MSKLEVVRQNYILAGELTPAEIRADKRSQPVKVSEITSFSMAPSYSLMALKRIERWIKTKRKLAAASSKGCHKRNGGILILGETEAVLI